nr:hypothetical protein [Tanacetum cinerariifolium]
MDLLHTLLETCTTLTKKVEALEQDKVAQAIEIIELKQRVKKLERKNKLKVSRLRRLRKGEIIFNIDADEDVILKDVFVVAAEVESQQRRPMTKKQKRDYYMAMIRNNLGWKVKDFKGITFEEIEAKFTVVWKQVEEFIPIGSKEEAKRLKRKCLNLEQEHVKKQKTSEEASEIEKSTEEIPEEKMKEMMQLVELKRLYEPDPEDQLWAQTQNYIHAPTEWKLYDLSGVHHVTAKDKEIFMIVEKVYPLRKGLALMMISYKLQIENYSQMAEDLIRKIYNIANTARQQGD